MPRYKASKMFQNINDIACNKIINKIVMCLRSFIFFYETKHANNWSFSSRGGRTKEAAFFCASHICVNRRRTKGLEKRWAAMTTRQWQAARICSKQATHLMQKFLIPSAILKKFFVFRGCITKCHWYNCTKGNPFIYVQLIKTFTSIADCPSKYANELLIWI